MTQDFFAYQMQAMQKIKKLQEVLGDKPFTPDTTLQSFQQSMIQVGAKFWQNMASNPDHWVEAQKRYFDYLNAPMPANSNQYERYFKSDFWNTLPYYQWLKDIYIKTATWMIETIEEESLGFSEDEKEKLIFLTRQIIEGMNPRNFPLTNPEVIKETMRTGGENFLRGLDNLIQDIERGTLSMTDETVFKVGENIATADGHVVYQNRMMELLHFPSTARETFAEPLVIVPPWINKYYILDLTPENSMIQWLCAQGHEVYCISWVNPDESYRDVEFKDYMHDGVLEAIDIVTKRHDCKQVNTVGYCIGGTLLAMTMAWLKGKKKSSPIKTATFLTTLLDFQDAGDLRVFIDKDQIQSLNKTLMDNGIMDGKAMSLSFSLLRASDLIWSFVINNYFMGKSPLPFDILYWNSDSTNLPAAMHCDYLQSMYLDNKLAKGDYTLDGVTLNLSKIDTPAYFLSTRDDHIAPWEATKQGADLLGSTDKTFVLGGSGHVAGVINPPHKNKYGYDVDDNHYDGSWWNHWQSWIVNHSEPPRKTTKIKSIKNLEKAPGTYILEKI